MVIFLACYLTGAIVMAIMCWLFEAWSFDKWRWIEVVIWPLALPVGCVRRLLERR